MVLEGAGIGAGESDRGESARPLGCPVRPPQVAHHLTRLVHALLVTKLLPRPLKSAGGEEEGEGGYASRGLPRCHHPGRLLPPEEAARGLKGAHYPDDLGGEGALVGVVTPVESLLPRKRQLAKSLVSGVGIDESSPTGENIVQAGKDTVVSFEGGVEGGLEGSGRLGRRGLVWVLSGEKCEGRVG